MLAATGLTLVVELFADTIPGIDSIWDVIHTVIRVPAGSALAASVLGGRDAVVPGRRAVPIASMH